MTVQRLLLVENFQVWRGFSLALFPLSVFAGCGELMSDNAGSQHSLLEDREACAREIDPTPTAYPEYMNQVFTDLNHCIDRKGGSKYGLSKS